MKDAKYLFYIILSVFFLHHTNSHETKRTLVLLDHFGIRETHSIYFKSLKDNGFQLTFKTADDANLILNKYGEYLYDHLIVFSPNVIEFGGNVSTKAIIDFIDSGGNVIVAAGPHKNEAIREIAGECGIDFSDEDTYVIDRFNHDVNDDGRNNLLAIDTNFLLDSPLIIGNSKNGNHLLYRGIGMSIDPENPLLLNILTSSVTSYTSKPNEKLNEYPHSVGKATSLISALQARNNARVLFVGSLEFFSNSFFESSVENGVNGKRFEKSGNEDICLSLSLWTFKQKGVLKVVSINHHKIGENLPSSFYTIKDDIVFKLKIEEYLNGKWEPFTANDVQLEFVRLDPFVRTTLKNKNGLFETQFKIPDVYGIYKFIVDYNRIGYTHLITTTQIPVRPLEHTQYERYIPAAYPYYISSFSMILTVFFLTFVMLYFKDSSTKSD